MSVSTNQTKRLSASFHAFHRSVMRRTMPQMMAFVKEEGLSMPQMGTLFFLRGGPGTVSAIAEHLDLSLAATSHLIERLVQRELVVRFENPADRRQKCVELSPAGLAFLDAADARAAAALEGVLETAIQEMPPPLIEAFEEALAGVVRALSEEGTEGDEAKLEPQSTCQQSQEEHVTKKNAKTRGDPTEHLTEHPTKQGRGGVDE